LCNRVAGQFSARKSDFRRPYQNGPANGRFRDAEEGAWLTEKFLEIERRLVGAHAWTFCDTVTLALLPVSMFWFQAARCSAMMICTVGAAVSSGIHLA